MASPSHFSAPTADAVADAARCATLTPMPIPDRDPATARLKPRPWLPIAGAVVGGLAGFAFYYFYGCDSG